MSSKKFFAKLTFLSIFVLLAHSHCAMVSAQGPAENPSSPAASDDSSSEPGDDDSVAGADLTESGQDIIGLLNDAVRGDGPARATAQRALAIDFALPAVIALLILIIGYLFAAFAGRSVGGLVSKKVDITFGRFLSKVIRYAIMMFVIFGVLSYFGVNVSAFAAVLAALGFAVGMALQGTLSNFAAGIMLLVFRPFEIGDYIVVSGAEGTVEVIDLFTTRLNNLEKRHLIVPNSQIFGSVIQNNSHNDFRRITVLVGADYSADLAETRAVLESAVASVPGQIDTENAEVYLVDLGDCAVNWRCRVWSKADDWAKVKEDLTVAVKNSLDAAKIGIPFPQLDVNVAGKILAKAS